MGKRIWLSLFLATVSCLVTSGNALAATTFTATELLGRPTATSVTVNVVPATDVEAYFEYGTSPGNYSAQTPAVFYQAGTPIVVSLTSLQPDTRYYYRMRYRAPGETTFSARPEYSFHTQRPPGSTFTFTVQADSHLRDPNTNEDLYRIELQNALADQPDFHVDLGDTFMSEKYGYSGGNAASDYLLHRPFFDIVGASVPVFLVNGNHEGEMGWLRNGTANSMAVSCTLARRKYFPCPVPGDFYTGSSSVEPFVGVRDGYYAWQWGDALFVVLDPFWNSTTKPTSSNDGWTWTLGEEQYRWLRNTLQGSHDKYKFVFIHHLVGGLGLEARGGIEGANLYEWGGHNLDGSWGFDDRRPGWGKPIAQVLADAGVSIVFHGHDHVYVKQDLYGVVYQECPRPDLARYTDTSMAALYGYVSGTVVANSGHLRVTVSPSGATVDYVRAYLPGDGANGTVAASYTVSGAPPPDTTPPGPVSDLTIVGGLAGCALSWSNPTDADFDHVTIVRKSGSDPTGPGDGVLVYGGSATSTTDAPLAPGTYHYGVWAFDAAGNGSSATFAMAVVGDFEAPTSAAALYPAPNAAGWNNASPVTVTLTATDTGGSGLAATYYTVGGGDQQTYAGPFTVVTQGAHIITYWSTDSAGNEETPHHTCYANIDTTAPTTTTGDLQADDHSGWLNAAKLVTLAPSDTGGSGLAATCYTVGGGSQQTYTGPFLVTTPGRNTVTYWSTDSAGNIEATRTGYVNIDTTPPATIDDAPADWRHTDVTLTLTPMDASSGMSGGLAKTEYSTDGGATWATRTVVSTPAVADHSNDGVHSISYRSIDNAGNMENPKSCEVKLDTRRPTTRAPYGASVVRGRYVSLRYRVNDLGPNGGTANVTIRIKTLSGRTVKTATFVNKPVNTLLSWRFRCSLVKKTYRYFVYATDAAGNLPTWVGRNALTVN